jgi:dephospho-CoA kinase
VPERLDSFPVRSLQKKPIIGILGGIGSGKSTVAEFFAHLGCVVIDADKIAHQALEEPVIKQKILDFFGQKILDARGQIDRKALADIAFGDKKKLSKLNSIIHPLVLRHCERLIETYNSRAQVKAIVLDVPLLLEAGWQKRCTRLIFVDCKDELRAARAKKTGIFNKNQLKIRENFQISLDNKAKVSDNTVDNNSDLSALAEQVTEIFSNIIKNG